MNMFVDNTANSVAEYLQNVPDNRKEDINSLHQLISETVPGLKSYFATNMLGYGSFAYLDSKKKPRDWPIIALANQKNYISVYVCAVEGDEYLAEKFADKLGKVNVGRSCIRIKKLEDVNITELKKVLKLAENSPGLVGATTVKN